MDKVFKVSQMEIPIKEPMWWVNPKVKNNIIGKLQAIIKVNLKMVWCMDRGVWKRTK